MEVKVANEIQNWKPSFARIGVALALAVAVYVPLHRHRLRTHANSPHTFTSAIGGQIISKITTTNPYSISSRTFTNTSRGKLEVTTEIVTNKLW